MFVSLIYIGRRPSERIIPKAEMDELIAEWRARHAGLHVRGALLVTSRHVAQVLEGPEESVDQLMADAYRELHHDNITVIERKPIDGYRFTEWCFAYWGSASYMDQKIAIVMERHDAITTARETAELYDLMRSLARESIKQRAPIGNAPPS